MQMMRNLRQVSTEKSNIYGKFQKQRSAVEKTFKALQLCSNE